MKLYEVYNPDLDVNIRYKVLSQEETEVLVLEHEGEKRDIFTRAVLENVIHNLKPEVTQSLRKIPKEKAKVILGALFTGCLMLNPGLDVDSWLQITNAPQIISETGASMLSDAKIRNKKPRIKKIAKGKFLNLERHLKDLIIGQDEAIEELVATLKRSQVGLGDEERPIGVFLFAGASGIGKTKLAKELHNYLFGESDLIRIDCGEYQHKHENQKLIGAPPGYLGYDEGGQLANELMKNPQTVVLLDEVEKAHPDMWHTFLRIFDEGMMTDGSGNKVSFRDAIIIMTTNLGNSEIVNDLTKSIGFSKEVDISKLPRRERVVRISNEAIKKQWSPEFLNRIDKVIVFNHLSHADYQKIAELELNSVHSKLEKRGFTLTFDPNILEAMVRDGVNHVQGARGLAQLRRDRIENLLADLMINGRFPQGTAFRVSHEAGEYRVTVNRPVSKSARSNRRAPSLVALPTI